VHKPKDLIFITVKKEVVGNAEHIIKDDPRFKLQEQSINSPQISVLFLDAIDRVYRNMDHCSAGNAIIDPNVIETVFNFTYVLLIQTCGIVVMNRDDNNSEEYTKSESKEFRSVIEATLL
jgi:hypothetical protein